MAFLNLNPNEMSNRRALMDFSHVNLKKGSNRNNQMTFLLTQLIKKWMPYQSNKIGKNYIPFSNHC
ncbi:hypothetical protein JOC95_001285 [Bacillus tianshenii]|uniref:Uncharacterized protein n=1 Tax=Sutcliffiella tianshenii TaxID=1463404 RepID=A0ABS2NXP3_9BACI|nr:hypothetical protein [Bacillus tianshenii]